MAPRWEYRVVLPYGMLTTSWAISHLLILCGYIPERLKRHDNDNGGN